MTDTPIKSFYEQLKKTRGDDVNLIHCIEDTVAKLIASDTSLKKPGVLLGKVQSGKTRAFLGVMAMAFDNGYDIAIILTKGTKPLTEQTLKRLHEDFGEFEEDNKVQIHDIMSFPKNMVPVKGLLGFATKVFSVANLQEFMAYLDSISAEATAEHMQIVKDVYGETRPYVSILQHEDLD